MNDVTMKSDWLSRNSRTVWLAQISCPNNISVHCSKRILICARNTLFLYPRLALTIQNIDRPSKTAPELYSDILLLFGCSIVRLCLRMGWPVIRVWAFLRIWTLTILNSIHCYRVWMLTNHSILKIVCASRERFSFGRSRFSTGNFSDSGHPPSRV